MEECLRNVWSVRHAFVIPREGETQAAKEDTKQLE
jgi:hypothetical protein